MDILNNYALRLLKARKKRADLFPAELFDEYAWEFLIALYIVRDRGEGIPRDDLCGMVGCSASIGQRWIDHLEARHQVVRSEEIVRLHDDALAPMITYLEGMVEDAIDFAKASSKLSKS